jgi:YD repeat-containing protein
VAEGVIVRLRWARLFIAIFACCAILAGSTVVSAEVSTYDGEYQYMWTDASLAIDGTVFAFRRTYNSTDPRVTPLGPAWTHSFNPRLHAVSGSADLFFVREFGRTDYLEFKSNGTWVSRNPVLHESASLQVNGEYEAIDSSGITWTFNSTGAAIAVQQNGKPRLTIIQAAYGPESVQLPGGRTLFTFAYDAQAGRMTSVCMPPGPGSSDVAACVQFGYDAKGRLTSVANRLNDITHYLYDGDSQRLTSIVDARGHAAVTLAYDDQGRVTKRTDPRGLQTGAVDTMAYDVRPNGSLSYQEHRVPSAFAPGWLPMFVDEYDATPQIVRATHQAAPGEDPEILTWNWGSGGQPVRPVHTGGVTLPRTGGIAASVLAGLPGGSSVVVGDQNSPIPTPTCIPAQVQPDSAVLWATRTRNADPRTQSFGPIARALLSRSDVKLDGWGRPTSFTDGDGQVWRIAFDAEDRPVRVMGPLDTLTADAPAVEYEYDAVGNVTRVADSGGNEANFVYDDRDSLSQARWSPGLVADYQYDEQGDLNLALVVQPDGSQQSAEYRHDALHRLRTFELSANGPGTSPSMNLVFAYDAAGGCADYQT